MRFSESSAQFLDVTTLSSKDFLTRIPQMGRLPADILALLIEEIQRLAQQEAGSFCFHPLYQP